ncbi:MAG: hypothetical protein CL608_04940 [Anaerolineaceae bacterium]|nr:hypothetical protein [Anaerolineaceae bacterium]
MLPTLALIVLIFTDAVPWLRGPAPETSEWYWPYWLRPFSHWWLPIFIGLLLLLVAGWWLRQPDQRGRNLLALLALSGIMIALQLAIIQADRQPVLAELVDRTLSNLSGGYFEPAITLPDLHNALQNYPELMPTFAAEHARTHPPGLLIANNLTASLFNRFPELSLKIASWVYPGRCMDLWLLERPFAVAAALFTWSLLPLLAAALTIWPGYALARHWLEPSKARLATLLIATPPALILFAPKVVQLYPPLVLLLFLCLVKGQENGRLTWYALAGLLYSLLTFLSLGNLALALPIALYLLLDWWRRQQLTANRLIKVGTVLSASGLSLWLLLWLGWGVPPWAIIQTGLEQHYTLVTLLRRYDWWIVWNLVDLLVFAGWPLLLGFGLALVGTVTAFRQRRLTSSHMLALSLLALILVLNFSGSARGEVGRLWLFFMPLLAIVGAGALDDWLPQRWQLLIVAAQIALTISLGLAWQPVRPVIVVAERPSQPADKTPETAVNVTFSETITLLGADLPPTDVAPGSQLPFTLYWQADGATLRPYTVFTQLLDASGQLVTQQDNWPVNGQWPPTCWQPDEVVVDSYQLSLPPDLADGRYTLIAGLYDARDGTRLLTNGSDHVVLQEITVGSAEESADFAD